MVVAANVLLLQQPRERATRKSRQSRGEKIELCLLKVEEAVYMEHK